MRLRALISLFLCTVIVLLASCRASAPTADAVADASAMAAGAVVARANGLPVLRDEFVASMRAGRLGGSPELILDELLGLTLVLHECERMDPEPARCREGGTVLSRASAFLDRLFPASRACGEVKDREFADEFFRLQGRRLPPDADPRSPEARLMVEGRICEARSIRVQRAYVTDLRRTARIDVDRAVYDAAVAEVDGPAAK